MISAWANIADSSPHNCSIWGWTMHTVAV